MANLPVVTWMLSNLINRSFHCFGQLHIVVRHIRFVLAFIYQNFPFFAVAGMQQAVLMKNVCAFSEEFRILIGVVDLDDPDRAKPAEVALDPLAGVARCGTPVVPVGQIVAPPTATLVGRKEVIIPFIRHDNRVCRGAVAASIAEIGNRRESVI